MKYLSILLFFLYLPFVKAQTIHHIDTLFTTVFFDAYQQKVLFGKLPKDPTGEYVEIALYLKDASNTQQFVNETYLRDENHLFLDENRMVIESYKSLHIYKVQTKKKLKTIKLPINTDANIYTIAVDKIKQRIAVVVRLINTSKSALRFFVVDFKGNILHSTKFDFNEDLGNSEEIHGESYILGLKHYFVFSGYLFCYDIEKNIVTKIVEKVHFYQGYNAWGLSKSTIYFWKTKSQESIQLCKYDTKLNKVTELPPIIKDGDITYAVTTKHNEIYHSYFIIKGNSFSLLNDELISVPKIILFENNLLQLTTLKEDTIVVKYKN